MQCLKYLVGVVVIIPGLAFQILVILEPKCQQGYLGFERNTLIFSVVSQYQDIVEHRVSVTLLGPQCTRATWHCVPWALLLLLGLRVQGLVPDRWGPCPICPIMGLYQCDIMPNFWVIKLHAVQSSVESYITVQLCNLGGTLPLIPWPLLKHTLGRYIGSCEGKECGETFFSLLLMCCPQGFILLPLPLV